MIMGKIIHPSIKLEPLGFRNEGGHYYQSKNGLWYQSVTTFLGKIGDQSGLDRWRERVGHEEADRIVARACQRGTATHQLLESYLIHGEVDTSTASHTVVDLFCQIRGQLKAHLSEVYMLETAIYSDHYQLAGTPDLIGIWDGHLSIIDFKTSGNRKRSSDVRKHFLQAAAYALLFDETMHHQRAFKPTQLVIIVANEAEPPAQVFVEPVASHVIEFDRLWQASHLAGHTNLQEV
jgi:hypothetical protein